VPTSNSNLLPARRKTCVLPPTTWFASSTSTFLPFAARYAAVVRPPGPAPTTTASQVSGPASQVEVGDVAICVMDHRFRQEGSGVGLQVTLSGGSSKDGDPLLDGDVLHGELRMVGHPEVTHLLLVLTDQVVHEDHGIRSE